MGLDLLALETQLAAALLHVTQLETQLADAQTNQPSASPADPKATEALTALVELAKALKLVAA